MMPNTSDRQWMSGCRHGGGETERASEVAAVTFAVQSRSTERTRFGMTGRCRRARDPCKGFSLNARKASPNYPDPVGTIV